MKKYLWIPILFIVLTALDFGWFAAFERPLFAIKDDSDSVDIKYFGLFYDVVDCFESETKILSKGSKYACPTSSMIELAPMLMVDGTLYVYSGMWHEMAKCGVMDGEITSHVASNTVPYTDHQANFTGASGYQIGSNHTIEIPMDGKWMIFVTEEKLKSYESYPLVDDLPEISSADKTILVRYEGTLYAKSYACVDVMITGEPDGFIEMLIPNHLVPVLDNETNQSELYRAPVYGKGTNSSILLDVNGVYELFEKVDE